MTNISPLKIERWNYQPAMLDAYIGIDKNIFSFINNQRILHDFIGMGEDENINIMLGQPIIFESKNNIYIVDATKKANFKKIFDICYRYENLPQASGIFLLTIAKQDDKINLGLLKYHPVDDTLKEEKQIVYKLVL